MLDRFSACQNVLSRLFITAETQLATHATHGLEPVPLLKRAFPVQGMRHDCVEIIVLRAPAEALADQIGLGHNLDRVTQPARTIADGEIRPRDRLDGLDHLLDREAVAITDIAGEALTARVQMVEGAQVRVDQV